MVVMRKENEPMENSADRQATSEIRMSKPWAVVAILAVLSLMALAGVGAQAYFADTPSNVTSIRGVAATFGHGQGSNPTMARTVQAIYGSVDLYVLPITITKSDVDNLTAPQIDGERQLETQEEPRDQQHQGRQRRDTEDQERRLEEEEERQQQ